MRKYTTADAGRRMRKISYNHTGGNGPHDLYHTGKTRDTHNHKERSGYTIARFQSTGRSLSGADGASVGDELGACTHALSPTAVFEFGSYWYANMPACRPAETVLKMAAPAERAAPDGFHYRGMEPSALYSSSGEIVG